MDQRAHLTDTLPRLKSVGDKPGSAELGGSAEPRLAPSTYFFNVATPHWLPMSVPSELTYLHDRSTSWTHL
jgi:hypothetical protein